MAVDSWSTTPASNASTLGIDIGEGCDAANINNALRQIMADVKTKFDTVAAGSGAGLQPVDATLTALAGVTTAADNVIYATGVDTFATTALTSFMRTLLDDTDATTACSTLGALRGSFTGTATSGGATINFGSTAFKLQWKDCTIPSGSSSQNFPTAYTSWARSWINGDDGASDVSIYVTSNSTTAASIRSSAGSSASCTLFSIGV